MRFIQTGWPSEVTSAIESYQVYVLSIWFKLEKPPIKDSTKINNKQGRKIEAASKSKDKKKHLLFMIDSILVENPK